MHLVCPVVTTTVDPVHTTTAESSTADVAFLVTTTLDTLPATTPESTTTESSTTTEDLVSTTSEVGDSSTDEVEQITTDHATTTDKGERTTTEYPATTDEVEPIITDYPITTTAEELNEEGLTTIDQTRTIDQLAQASNAVPTTDEFVRPTADVTKTIEDLVATTSEKREPKSTSTTETSSLSSDPPIQSNLPGITLESISRLKVDIPEGCFEGISDLCQSNAMNVTSCSNSTVSDLLVDQIVNSVSIALGIPVIVKDADFSTSVTHNSICEDNQETDWVETYEIKSSESREPNSTYDVSVVLLRQEFTAISFLQVSINSFGTSSIQHACSFVNGDAIEFSSVPGGIVGGYSVSEDVYDCSYYVTVQVQSYDQDNSTSSSFVVAKNAYPDLSDEVGLALEYLIVCVYILISLYGAYRSYKVHQLQRTRSDFKTNVNIGFIALFSIWASGNLLYMLLYSVAATKTSFFYIKQVLTLTYFITYFGFTLIIHYRYVVSFSHSYIQISRNCQSHLEISICRRHRNINGLGSSQFSLPDCDSPS
jgi:hypothetical protein